MGDMVPFLIIPMVEAALYIEQPKVLQVMVVTDMEVMDMVVTMARDLLSQDTMAAPALMSNRAVLITMDLMAMVSTTMARGPLSQDTMAVPALMSNRAVLTTMDLMAMVSTTMARGLLMLDIMAMDMPMVAAATSRLTGHTLPMVSVLLILTK